MGFMDQIKKVVGIEIDDEDEEEVVEAEEKQKDVKPVRETREERKPIAAAERKPARQVEMLHAMRV